MARIDTLANFLTDVATAIRTKLGTSETISPANFDTEINNIQTGGGIPEIKITKKGTHNTKVSSNFGAGINADGILTIWTRSNSTSYPNITYEAEDLGVGTKGFGWDITDHKTTNPYRVPYACTVNGLGGYSTIEITLDAKSTLGNNNGIKIYVTIVAS